MSDNISGLPPSYDEVFGSGVTFQEIGANTASIDWNSNHSRAWQNGMIWRIPSYTFITFIVTDGRQHTITAQNSRQEDIEFASIKAGSTPDKPIKVQIVMCKAGKFFIKDIHSSTEIHIEVTRENENNCGVIIIS